MKVRTWVETAQEIEVDVSIAEVMASIGELIESDRPAMVLDCISRACGVLKHLSDDQINLLTPCVRQKVAAALRAQADRYAGPDQSCEIGADVQTPKDAPSATDYAAVM